MIATINSYVIPATMNLLPVVMDGDRARAMLLAIGFQESRFGARRQITNKNPSGLGPARGFWQFEEIGVREVLENPKTERFARALLKSLSYYSEATSLEVHKLIEHNDILACGIARLNLWRHPRPLPTINDPEEGWLQYINIWKPGAPHRKTWDGFYNTSWGIVNDTKRYDV